MMKTAILTACLVVGTILSANITNNGAVPGAETYPVTESASRWVDSIYNVMTDDERIGQLFMIRAHSDKGEDHVREVAKFINTYHVGGLCFFQGTPEKQASLTNYYQTLSSRVPLMVSMDAEWGLGMRLKETTVSYPRQLGLGAIQDNTLIYDMGKEIARQCRRLGVHVNFAPDADINNNANNPVINTRSFGENRYNVLAKSAMYMRGMQDNNVMACAKHFPGHGDTDTDSHFDLPQVNYGMERLEEVELFPFKSLAQHGIQSMMIAHLSVPSIDATANLPTSLSRKAITELLREKMGYQGLIFTDGLEMKGVTKYFKDGEVEARAIQAGVDILLLPEDIAASFAKIKTYIQRGDIDQTQIERSVKRILHAKYRLGLMDKVRPYIDLNNLSADLNNAEAKGMKRRLTAATLTVVRNENNIFPIQDFSKKIAVLTIGAQLKTTFQKTIAPFGSNVQLYNISKTAGPEEAARMANSLVGNDLVLIALNDLSSKPKDNYGLTEATKNLVEQIRQKTKTGVIVFGNPYLLKHFDNIDNIIVAYDEDPITQELAAQGIAGVFGMNGKMPVTASPRSNYKDGVETLNLGRFTYDFPEAVGLKSTVLAKIDTIMDTVMRTGAAPGGVVFIAKDGKVVFEKAYGYHTYEKMQPVAKDDIYDLASITKVAASTLTMMKLVDEGKIDVKQPMSKYLPLLKGTNKETLTVEEIMSHHAGLYAWLKFYLQTLTTDKTGTYPSPNYYSQVQNADFSIPVTEKMFLKTGFPDSMYQQIAASNLRENKNYKYSDLGFFLIARLIKEQTGMTEDEYVQKNFYQPMGLKNISYKPWEKFSMSRIPPTEVDTYFRKQKIQGYVHDMGASMLGGVSGHAGLFSDARDLAALFQMLVNDGMYGGKQYISPKTIKQFATRYVYSTRRGVGFDMKELSASHLQNVCAGAPETTFGHTGFTGTCVWADPENKIVYVFLSNRTFPDMDNNKMNKLDYRMKIQQVIYDAMR
jgi:beta-N-acetylhexosaminidase